MTPIAKQTESYRMARRILSACNRMKAGRGPALKWHNNQREVLVWMCRETRKRIGRGGAQ